MGDNFRRTWDKDKYEKLAKDRTKKDSGRLDLLVYHDIILSM